MKSAIPPLATIIECIARIEQYSAMGREVFLANNMAQDAVVRNFEIIGEAAKRIPQQQRAGFPDIPWRSLTGFRDVLAHNYDRIELWEVWNVIERDLPPLKKAVQGILAALKMDPSSL